MDATTHIAVDLGAESGRVMLGTVDPDPHPSAAGIALEELHRFPSHRFEHQGSTRWDVDAIYRDILVGLAGAPEGVASVSCDSWGVDYVLLKNGKALAPPFMYRDPRTDGVFERMTDADRRAIFDATGVQFMPINTLYQLIAEGDALGGADALLMIGDYFNYLLSGVARQEVSLASTSQLYDPKRHAWSEALCDRFALPRGVLPEIVQGGTVLGGMQTPSGTALGPLRAPTVREGGDPDPLPDGRDLRQTITEPLPYGRGSQRDVPHGGVSSSSRRVVATCSHDTGCAVAATPLHGKNSAYLSSGTWSLLGVELDAPVLTDAARAANFTNEVGYGHTIRFLKNISGLFMVQECRGDFPREQRDYATLARRAAGEAGWVSLVRPDAPDFARPGDMCRKIADYCGRTGQPIPASPGAFVRCIYDSLALLYRETLDALESLTGRRIETLHVVGGGSKSALLNQLAADATGRRVIAGPAEATAIGNVGIQAITAGTLPDLKALRDLVRGSFALETFEPAGPPGPDVVGRFHQLPR